MKILIRIPNHGSRAKKANAELKKFDSWIIKRLSSEISPPKFPLFHYTSRQGLLGILNSGQLRLVSVFRQADEYEILGGMKSAQAVLEARANLKNPFEKLFTENFHRALGLNVDSVMNSVLPNVAHFFVCSLTKSRKSPRMWRQYASRGRGYCLQFSPCIAERFFGTRQVDDGVKSTGGSFPIEVEYAPSWFLSHATECVEQALMAIRRTFPVRASSPNWMGSFLSGMSTKLAIPLLELSSRYKRTAFQFEREWRLLRIVAKNRQPIGHFLDPKCRDCVSWNIRQEIGKRPTLERVFVGPRTRKDDEKMIRRLLIRKGFPSVQVRRSHV